MSKVASTAEAGSIIRRIREERGISRATLAKTTGIGARTLYALEVGEAENFGLGRYLNLLDALGLSMSIDEEERSPGTVQNASQMPAWDDMADVWKLEGESK